MSPADSDRLDRIERETLRDETAYAIRELNAVIDHLQPTAHLMLGEQYEHFDAGDIWERIVDMREDIDTSTFLAALGNPYKLQEALAMRSVSITQLAAMHAANVAKWAVAHACYREWDETNIVRAG